MNQISKYYVVLSGTILNMGNNTIKKDNTKRADELVIANIEKGKRADELVIANIEKEKQLTEKELLIQQKEKIEKMNSFMVNRELKMVELKNENRDLRKKLENK